MKSLFKLKKCLIISSAVFLPVAGVTVAVPLLTQQHSIVNVQQKEVSEVKFSGTNKSIPTLPSDGKKEPNKIYKDKDGKPTVKWENAKIEDVSKELSKLEGEKPKPVKPQVIVTIIKKDPIVPKPPKPEFQPKTLGEKIFQIIKEVKGNETEEQLKVLKDKIDKVKAEHFKQQQSQVK